MTNSLLTQNLEVVTAACVVKMTKAVILLVLLASAAVAVGGSAQG